MRSWRRVGASSTAVADTTAVADEGEDDVDDDVRCK